MANTFSSSSSSSSSSSLLGRRSNIVSSSVASSSSSSSSSLLGRRSFWRLQEPLSLIRIDMEGKAEATQMDRMALMRLCKLPPRDLRLLDPLLASPSTILGRHKAIVLNLERIRCIITAHEVFLLSSLDHMAMEYVMKLQQRLQKQDNPFTSFHMASSSFTQDGLPFEFHALEVALEDACSFLDSQVLELQVEAFLVLDGLTSRVNTINLERTRKLKSKLVALTSRVTKVRDGLEHLMDDDGDMAEMYLTKKKDYNEAEAVRMESYLGHSTLPPGASKSVPVSPVGSPLSQKLIRSRSLIGGVYHNFNVPERYPQNIEELEMLLEAYYVAVDATLNKLLAVREYIDDTEVFINTKLDNVQNQLIQIELLLTSATFIVAVVGVIFGVFGMNFPLSLFDEPEAFKWVITLSVGTGLILLFSILWFLKWQRLMPL